jgi:hypothetical protein
MANEAGMISSRNFPFPSESVAGSGTCLAFCPMDILGFLLGVKTTAYIHIALKLRMLGAVPLLPNLPT